MTDSYITAKIRRVKQDPRYVELLLLQRLPMPDPEEPEMAPAPAAAAPQASTSQESPSSLPQSADPSPEEKAIDSAGHCQVFD